MKLYDHTGKPTSASASVCEINGRWEVIICGYVSCGNNRFVFGILETLPCWGEKEAKELVETHKRLHELEEWKAHCREMISECYGFCDDEGHESWQAELAKT